MPDGVAVTREQAAEYLHFLKSLGWTHVAAAAPSRASVPASERASVEAPIPPAPLPFREGGIGGLGDSPESTSQQVNESSSPPSPHRPIASSHEEPDLFATPAEAVPPLPRADRIARLAAREEELATCELCKLCPGRNDWAHRLVYGVGDPEARLVFIGEGPGEEEDNQGIPFVGKAGQLLTKIIVAMGLTREQVYICNVVKHRAPNNRDPEGDEIAACEPFLLEQLDVIRPQVLVTLGNCATKTLLRTKEGITRLRGTWQRYHGIPTMPTFHPAFLLRSYTEANRKAVWSDMKLVMEKIRAAE